METNEKPFYYSLTWAKYLEEYNKFYGSELKIFEICNNDIYFWLITIYYSEQRKKLELRMGDSFFMTPYWKNEQKKFKIKNLTKWFQKLNQVYLENNLEGEIMIHQFPLDTYYHTYPYLEMLDYSNSNLKFRKTIVRYRSWVELYKYNFDEILSLFGQSTKREIKKFFKNNYQDVIIYDYKSSFDVSKLAQEFEELHYKQAQKKTKSKKGWELLIQMIKEDQAIMIQYQDNMIYFLIHPEYSYNGICASSRDGGIQRAITMVAIDYLLKRNFKLFDVGMIHLDPNFQPELPAEIADKEKMLKISYFKTQLATKITPDYYYVFST